MGTAGPGGLQVFSISIRMLKFYNDLSSNTDSVRMGEGVRVPEKS